MYSYGPPHTAVQKQDDQHEHTFKNYVRIQDVVLKTCLRRWTIGKSGERGSGISVLPARHDDDDDDISMTFIINDDLYNEPNQFILIPWKILLIFLNFYIKYTLGSFSLFKGFIIVHKFLSTYFLISWIF